jgi:putative heme-binding domain-containing protein
VGRNLSKIGAIRTGGDLLGAIVFPSASLVRGFASYVISTRGGHPYRRSQPPVERLLSLVTAERTEVRSPRSSIETLERSPVSLMPQTLDAQLSRQEQSDLIAFLRSLHRGRLVDRLNSPRPCDWDRPSPP